MSAIVNVVLPIFGLILAGYVCRRSGRLVRIPTHRDRPFREGCDR